jgi:hypothetical protein
MSNPAPTTSTTLLPSPQAAAWLGVKPQTLRKWRCQGKGPRFVRMGIGPQSPAAYRLADLEVWVESRSFQSTAEETVATTDRA